jgi:hypothetical protein
MNDAGNWMQKRYILHVFLAVTTKPTKYLVPKRLFAGGN